MIFYRFRNASAYKAEKDERIRNFLQFIHTNEPGKDEFSNRLSALVEKVKNIDRFRSDYTAMNLHDRDITRAAKKEGIIEGEQRKAIETAENFLKMNLLTHEQISQGTGLPLEQIKALAAKTSHITCT